MKDCVIVLSGGVDSVTLLYEYRERIGCALSFIYGANHNKKELECAKYHCEQLNIEHIVINLDFIGKFFNSQLLGKEIAEYNGERDIIHKSIVPFRNGIFLAVACGFAESRKFKYVLIANHFGVIESMPDCTNKFIAGMNDAMRFGTLAEIEVLAPYTDVSKSEIVKRGVANNLDYKQTYSCYKGNKNHCGKCKACVERKEAFADAGVDDPTEYEQ